MKVPRGEISKIRSAYKARGGDVEALRERKVLLTVEEGLGAGEAWVRAYEALTGDTWEISGEAASAPVVEDAVDGGDPLTASERVVVQWVFDNMHNRGVKQKDAPTLGAWGLLQECREDGTTRRNFYMSVWPKLLPSRSELDKEGQFEDDNRDLEGHLEELAKWHGRGDS